MTPEEIRNSTPHSRTAPLIPPEHLATRIAEVESELMHLRAEIQGMARRIGELEKIVVRLPETLARIPDDSARALSSTSTVTGSENEAPPVEQPPAPNAGEEGDAFTRRLTRRYPLLTPAEVRICAMLRENLPTKEIARRLHRSRRNIEGHRYSIRKKLGLKRSESLVTVLAGF